MQRKKFTIINSLILFIIGFALVYLGVQFRSYQSYPSPVWPATGFFIAITYLFGLRTLLLVASSYLLVMLATNTKFELSLIFTLGEILEVFVGCFLLRRFNTFGENKKYGSFLYENLAVATIAGLTSAMIGVNALLYFDFIKTNEFISQLSMWAIGDALGYLVIAPIFILNSTKKVRTVLSEFWQIPIDVWIVFAMLNFILFYFSALHSYIFLSFLGLLYFALRAEAANILVANFIFYIFSIYMTIMGFTPFVSGTVTQNLSLLQFFLFAVSSICFALYEVKQIQALQRIRLHLFFALLFIGGLFYYTYHFENDKDERRFDRITDMTVDSIQERINTYLTALSGGRSLFLANDNFNYKIWKKYVDSLDIVNKYPGINGMGIIRKVPNEKLPEYLNYAKHHLDPNFKYKTVPNVVAPEGQFRYIISMLEPIAPNKSALGLDVASEINRKTAAELSAKENVPTMTKKIILIQDNQHRPGFLVYVPIYVEKNNQSELFGWAYAPFVTENFLKIPIDRFNKEIKMTVYDSSNKNNAEVIFDNQENYNLFKPRTLSKKITLAKQDLLIEFQTTPYFLSQNYLLTLSTMIFSILVLILFMGILTSFHSSVVQANKLAEELSYKLVQSSKLTALGEMAGGIAHEVNNPLAIIVGRLDQLKFRLENDNIDKESTLQTINKILATTERITKIIKGLKSFSRNSDQLPIQSTQLSLMIEGALDLCREKFKAHGIEIKESPVPNIEINAREVQISQVILNLLNNSHDAIANLSEKWIQLEYEQSQDTVKILVTDSGSGIPEDVANKIMQPFFTTKEVGKGTGLGLSISKGIIEEHKGKFYLDRAYKNTRFVIELPYLKAQSNSTDSDSSHQSAA